MSTDNSVFARSKRAHENYEDIKAQCEQELPELSLDRDLVIQLMELFSHSIKYNRIDSEFDTVNQYPIHMEKFNGLSPALAKFDAMWGGWKVHSSEFIQEKMDSVSLSSATVRFSGHQIQLAEFLVEVIRRIREHDKIKAPKA